MIHTILVIVVLSSVLFSKNSELDDFFRNDSLIEQLAYSAMTSSPLNAAHTTHSKSLDTNLLSAEEFKKEYWHSRVTPQQLAELSRKDPRAKTFISGVTLFNNQKFKEALVELEKSVVYSNAYRELSVRYLYQCYFELRNYAFAFMVLQNYYAQVNSPEVKNIFIDELIRTAPFLGSQISSNNFWSIDSIAEYKDYLSQKDSLLGIINELDPNRPYNKLKLAQEMAHSAYARGNVAQGDSLCFYILKSSNDTETIRWAYTKINEFSKNEITDFQTVMALGNAEYSMGEYSKALQTFNGLLARNPNASTKTELIRKVAFAYKTTSQYKKAIKQYKYLIASPKSRAIANDYLNIARCYRSLGHKTTASKWYTTFTKRYPNHYKALEIKWTKGFEFEQNDKLSKALKEYKKFRSTQLKSKRGKWVGFRKGYVEYKRGRYTSAIRYFKKVIDDPELLWPGSASHLFLGKSYLKLGKRDEARDWFLKTIEDYPVGFYGYRAKAHLKEESLAPDSVIPSIQFQELNDDETIEWLREQQKKRTDISEAHLLEIETLLAVGCWDAAEKRYSKLYAKKVGRLDYMYVFSKLFLEYGNIAQSYRITRQMAWRIDRRSLMNPPRRLMELLYLRPYYDKVKELATNANINPYFVLALMRQESIFDSDIMSGAGAFGLMQIMPYTGKELARREKIDGFDSQMLFNPYLAIQLGIRYIGDLMKIYGSEYYVLANYNAGPTPTKRWKKNNGHLELDLFIEEVSYWETRDYLKKVMGNYWTYQQVWADK